MRVAKYLPALCVVLLGHQAASYEYPLQFTPNGGARGVTVAGYAFNGNTVVGNCSYYTQSSGSGRGGGYKTSTTHYYQTCTWDLYGNLLGIVAGAPVVPAPLGIIGTETIYATNAAGGATGSDTKFGGGFVNTIGAHYTWDTPNPYEVVQKQKVYRWAYTLTSDGDVPVVISSIEPISDVAVVGVHIDECLGRHLVGHSCSISVDYDPTRLSSPSGLAYDTLTLAVTSNAGQANDFVQHFTLVVRVSDSND